jgi:hypothetical protein
MKNAYVIHYRPWLTFRVEGVSRMVAVGLGLEADTFVDAGKYGSHLLAPTATDLDRFGKADTYVCIWCRADVSGSLPVSTLI